MDRLVSYLPAARAREFASRAGVSLLAIDRVEETLARRVATALETEGAVAEFTPERLVVAASAGQLAAAARTLEGAARELTGELIRAERAGREVPSHVRLRDITLDLAQRARVMGILNVTPDSFYDRGAYAAVDDARRRAVEMVELGADLIDIGGQSYAHWNPQVAADEERRRVVPVVEALVRENIGVPLSIDTFKASVAEAALAAGAALINDCSGLGDPELASVVAKYDASLVVMHLKGELNVRAPEYRYDDAMGEILNFLRDRCDAALAAGVKADALIIDPGLEFGKEPPTDLEILDRFGDLRGLGYPILFAASRKSFLGRVFDRPARELLVPSLTTAMLGIVAGARLVRVHDVRETRELATTLAAIRPDKRATLTIRAAMPETPIQHAGN